MGWPVYDTDIFLKLKLKLGRRIKLLSPVVYEDQPLELLQGLCQKCYCCRCTVLCPLSSVLTFVLPSGCARQCLECGRSGELEAQLSRIMDIQGVEVDRAKQYAEQCGEEERVVFDVEGEDGDVSEDGEGEGEGEGEVGEEDEEGEHREEDGEGEDSESSEEEVD